MESLGIFIQGTTAVGVLIVAILTFMGRTTNALRDDIGILREDIKGLRTEMNTKFSEVRIEMHDMNTRLGRVDTRLGRVEGHLRITDDQQIDR